MPTEQQRPVINSTHRHRRGGHPTGRVSREQWLDAALDALATGGLDAVRVDRIAKALNISRSGFYWHFSDRNALLEEMKQYWVGSFTQAIADEIDAVDLPPADRLLKTSSLIISSGANRYDIAFWSWAKLDPSVAEIVYQVAQIRTDFIRQLIRDLGFAGDDLEARTRMFVTYHSLGSAMYPADKSEQAVALAAPVVDLIIAR